MNTPPKDKPKVITDPAVTAETDDLNTDNLSTDEAVAAGDTEIISANDENEHQKETEHTEDLNVDQSKVGLNNETDQEFL
jgi:hypothetical protein